MMSMLDRDDLYTNLDPTSLRDRLDTFHLQCRNAWDEAEAFDLASEYRGVGRVVILGMGGSAIGGDLLGDLMSLEDAPPIEVCRDFRLPRYVGPNTLVLACSYSGNTGETLAAFREACSKEAKLVVVTKGGLLGTEAEKFDLPCFTVNYEGEPRSAIGYSFLVPLRIMSNLDLIRTKSEDVAEAVDICGQLAQKLGTSIPTERNPAKELALALKDRLPIIYGSSFFGGVAHRWKTQFNENSKVWASWDMLPEANHNSAAGYGLPVSVKKLAVVLLLRPQHLHTSLALRYQVTEELLSSQGVAHRLVVGEGVSPLAQILTTVLLGDYVTYYLALLQGVDPSPVPPIDFIKSRLG